MRGLGLFDAAPPEAEAVVEAALALLGERVRVASPAWAAKAHAVLMEAVAKHPRNSGPWVAALRTLETHFAGLAADGTPLGLKRIKREAEGRLFPNVVRPDEADLAFKSALPRNRIDELTKSLADVRANFFRVCPFADPVAGDRNDTIAVAIYPDRASYRRFQPFLYGHDGSAGGVYDERIGTVFTYDRPAATASTLSTNCCGTNTPTPSTPGT